MVATPSTRTLRGLREFCEALNSYECEIRGCEAFVSNAPKRHENFHFYLVTRNVHDALKKSASFRTLHRLHELAKPSTLTTLHGVQFIQDFTTTLIMHQARLMLPLHFKTFGGVNHLTISRTQNSSAALISSSESSSIFLIRNTTLK